MLMREYSRLSRWIASRWPETHVREPWVAFMEGISRSKLLFAGGHDGPETVPIKNLRRVREPVSRSKSGVQGKVADVLQGRSRHAESQNEIKAFRILAATARADAWQVIFDWMPAGAGVLGSRGSIGIIRAKVHSTLTRTCV